MSNNYDMMIDSLVQSSDVERLKSIRSREIVLQLQSFLNVQFSHEEIHFLKGKVHRRIRRRLERLEREQMIVDEASKQTISDVLFPFIYPRVYKEVWIDLLYRKNLGSFVSETQEQQSLQYRKVATASIPKPDSNMMIKTLIRDNMSLLSSIDYTQNISDYNISRVQFKHLKKQRNRRARARYQNIDPLELIKRASKVSEQKLYSWSEEIQSFLNITLPLTTREVFTLIWRYIGYVRERNKDFSEPDQKLGFLLNGRSYDNLQRRECFNLMMKHRNEVVGQVSYDGSRTYEKDGEIIPIEGYNVSMDEITELVELKKSAMNVPREFRRVIKNQQVVNN